MTKEVFNVIADENELKWFFDHVIQKPQVNESYSAVFVCRHKKLTKEEQEQFGLTRKESEFLMTQTFRLARFKDALYIDEDSNWTFNNFLKKLRRFEVNKESFITDRGFLIPETTTSIVFYVNPADDIKVVQEFVNQYLNVNQAISKAMLNGKTTVDNLQSYQWFGNAENNIKHLKATQKGSKYWCDFDVDVPHWFRDDKIITEVDQDVHTDGHIHLRSYTQRNKYYKQMIEKLNARFGKGNYVIVDTSGGYHILVRTNSIRSNPHDFCKEVEAIYKQGVADGNPEYLDEKGVCKFEAIVNDSQIPGLPLPGTYQYGRKVTVLNKEDFE